MTAEDRTTQAVIPPPLPTHEWSQPTDAEPQEPGTATGPSCELCGRRRAAPVTFHQVIGLLLARRVRTVSGTYCRDCGLALGRSVGNSTLWTGWWGIISFFSNIGFVLGNAGSLMKHGRLGKPSGTGTSLDPGRSLLLRSGTLFLIALVAVGGGLVAAASSSEQDSSRGGSSADPPGWETGACISKSGGSVVPVSCSGDYDGEVIDEVLSDADCPSTTDGFVENDGLVYCIDTY